MWCTLRLHLHGTFFVLTLKVVDAAGSSQANPFACVASGIAALWGPAHGGANEVCSASCCTKLDVHS